MIRSDKILEAFLGGVGFRQPTLSGLPTIDSDNLTSSSGLHFEDADFLISIQNIYDTQNDPDITDEEFNTLLQNLQKASILEVANKVTDGQSDFIQASNLYPYEKAFRTVLEPSNRAVGFQIEPKCHGKVLQIPWVELSFNATVTFKVYLYNSNLKDPIAEKEVTTSADESKIVDLNWYIQDDSSYKGGAFYLVYLEDDIGEAKAYKKDYELSNLQRRTRYYNVEPIYLSHSDGVLNVADSHETSDVYGLNIGVNVYTDYTEILIRNKSLFWNAIRHQMTERVLNLIATSTRTNMNERINQAKFAFYGNGDGEIEGITSKVKRAIGDLRKMLFYQPRVSTGTLR